MKGKGENVKVGSVGAEKEADAAQESGFPALYFYFKIKHPAPPFLIELSREGK